MSAPKYVVRELLIVEKGQNILIASATFTYPSDYSEDKIALVAEACKAANGYESSLHGWIIAQATDPSIKVYKL